MKMYLPRDGGFNYREFVAKVPERDRNGYEMWPIKNQVFNARLVQDSYPSNAAFFKDFGFCLLKHQTKCKEWNDDRAILDSEISRIYNPECEALLRE